MCGRKAFAAKVCLSWVKMQDFATFSHSPVQLLPRQSIATRLIATLRQREYGAKGGPGGGSDATLGSSFGRVCRRFSHPTWFLAGLLTKAGKERCKCSEKSGQEINV